MKRQEEVFNYQELVVGRAYSKNDAMATGKVRLPKNSRELTGITCFKNSIILFVTLDKSNKKNDHKYNDVFTQDGKRFHWESHNTNTEKTSHMQRIFARESVILFARVHEKIKGKTQNFIYIGRLSYIEYENTRPVEVLYDVLDYQSSPDKALSSIYTWEKNEELESNNGLPPLLKKEKSTYQGQLKDAEKKKAIELYAMEKAKHFYEQRGFKVIDTSSKYPYDLECHKGSLFIRVEVKGTTTAGAAVYVTSNEVRSALSDDCQTDLYILKDIKIYLNENGEYVADGGIKKLIENWKPEQENLEVTVYRYHVN